MPLKYSEGLRFPSLPLVDDRYRETTIEQVAEGMPLILAFYRGPW